MNPITQIWTIINYIYSTLPNLCHSYHNNGPGGIGKLKHAMNYGDCPVSVEDDIKKPKTKEFTLDRPEGGKVVMDLMMTRTNVQEEEEEIVDDGSSWEDDDGDDDDPMTFHIGEVVTPVKNVNETKPDMSTKLLFGFQKFSIVDHLPATHKFFADEFCPVAASDFMRAYHRDLKILRHGLPNGIFVKGFEQRMDLFSALILGPEGTPYESGLFAFDIKLPSRYPHRPPKIFYKNYTTKTRLNPNLYTNGKVCVSLLGTWPSRDKCESWSSESTLLQVLISIQGLILVQEPYFNEPGKTRDQSDTTMAYSKSYNENVILKLLQGIIAMLQNPPMPWTLELKCIFKHELPKLIARIEGWTTSVSHSKPAFPLNSMWRHHEIPQLIQELRLTHKKYCSN